MTEEWKRTKITESGNYPKQSFKGVLAAIYPTVTESGIPVLQLDFEDGKTYNMPTSNKDGTKYVHESGEVDVYPLNEFLKSIEKLDATTGLPTDDEMVKKIETFFAFLNGNPAGFKTDPDIVGKTLHNVARPRQVGDATQTSKYPDWTIGQVDGLTAQTAKKPGRYPPKPKAPKEQPQAEQADITGIVLDALPEPRSVSELFTALGKKHKVSELRTALDTLKAQGVVVESAGKYQVV